MNQILADFFLSLPSALRAPRIFGTVCLALCWGGYWIWLHCPIARLSRERCGEVFYCQQLSRPWHRVFFSAARKKARLDEGGRYLMNALCLWFLLVMSLIQLAALILPALDVPLTHTADVLVRALLSLTVGLTCVIDLAVQPSATVERRMRWGFGKVNAVVHAVLWQAAILAVLFLWLYDAWFLPAFVTI